MVKDAVPLWSLGCANADQQFVVRVEMVDLLRGDFSRTKAMEVGDATHHVAIRRDFHILDVEELTE
jgi:hypothetical protein